MFSVHGRETRPQEEESKYLRVLITSEGKMESKIQRRVGAVSDAVVVPFCCEERAQPKGPSGDSRIDLTSRATFVPSSMVMSL